MTRWMALGVLAATVLALAVFLRSDWTTDLPRWQRHVSPGSLSASHASLETNCTACHTPVKSAEATKCIACHANNAALLQRQPTAFHATIGACATCHVEHQGRNVRPVAMDHAALAEIGLAMVRRNADDPPNRQVLAWLREHDSSAVRDPAHPNVTATEGLLACASCHRTKDPHKKLFGEDCASCHATGSWGIPDFRHPSPRSVDCVQCHQAPPSHYMMHFQMVSQAVARQPTARVDQCFACHQTTTWNDIRGVGWYKHH